MRILMITLLLLSGCREKAQDSDSSEPQDSTSPDDTSASELEDADGDGVNTEEDCDDTNATVFPGAEEVCDGVDNDCNGETDEETATDVSTWYIDNDSDGYGSESFTMEACEPLDGWVDNAGDCDDSNAAFHPNAVETDCADPLDYNCDGSVGYVDADADGFAACEDCDDSEPTANDDGDEVCDGLDNDCNGFVDSADPGLTDGTTYYGDADGDGYGGTQFITTACELPAGYTAASDDCDDTEATTHPGATEVCDEQDNNCDGTVDEGVETTWYADSDQDGYGDAGQTASACSAPPGHVSNGNDCNDNNAQVSPAAYEICDSTDNDCDGDTDEDALNPTTWYVDSDGDGNGVASGTTLACSQPSGYADNTIDCNDSDATSTTTLTDGDCDGTLTADDCDDSSATSTTVATDADCDGTLTGDDCNDADGSSTTVATDADCDGTLTADDCNDSDASSNTVATDADCDGTITADDCNDSDASSNTVATDADCDGTLTADDCDDSSATSTTVATDADCDGTLTADDCNDSDASSNTVATDADCDGTLTADDCNDSDASSNTVANDADCDGTLTADDCNDSDGSSTTVATDADCDGFITADDCNDSDDLTNPNAVETCDGLDNNCNGESDEGLLGTNACYPTSCLDLVTRSPSSSDGTHWIQPLSTPVEVYCDMTGGGWTLVYLGTNAGGVAQNGTVTSGNAIGTTPFTPSSTGHYKLEDTDINALRSGSVSNDLKVVIRINGSELDTSWHPSACTLESGTWLSDTHICNASSTVGPNDTNLSQSGHNGSLSRWYVAPSNAIGYIWPNTHIGPISGGTGGSNPATYCTYYDGRHCPQSSQFEIWAY